MSPDLRGGRLAVLREEVLRVFADGQVRSEVSALWTLRSRAPQCDYANVVIAIEMAIADGLIDVATEEPLVFRITGRGLQHIRGAADDSSANVTELWHLQAAHDDTAVGREAHEGLLVPEIMNTEQPKAS